MSLRDEFDVLVVIEEGIDNLKDIRWSVGMSEGDVRDIILRLEKKGWVSVDSLGKVSIVNQEAVDALYAAHPDWIVDL